MIIQPVILSGGSGSRLWPLSREHYPKQLLPLVGELTMLQETVQRLTDLPSVEVAQPLIICNEEHRFLVGEQLRLVGITPANIILEPVGRNTAPALTLAALFTAQHHGDAALLVMPADHVIQDRSVFQAAIKEGQSWVQDGFWVTFGIVPTRPETGYGYIEKGVPLAGRRNSPLSPCSLAGFVEKPDPVTAKAYMDSGRYLWNSGIFMMGALAWLDAIKGQRPDIAQACDQAFAEGRQDGPFYRVQGAAFKACASDSIDYAVMERLPDSGGRAVTIPLEAGWSDVGAWSTLWEISAKDAHGNTVQGDVITQYTENSLLIARERVVAAVGLQHMIVIETADAVLVAHKDKAQEVKAVVDRLKSDGRSEHLIHRRVYRPWGSYECLVQGDRFQVKRIIVNPKAALSLQMHHHRAEHWIVVRGTARVIRGEESFLLTENQSTYMPLGVIHRLENPGLLPLEMIEVQSGSYLGEDDIVRFEDVYGREQDSVQVGPHSAN
jgi:mannose-1-phosphate guanylyltransferase/mannose-6-phosphate isomerase